MNTLVDEALARRRPLLDDASVDACRLFHGRWDGVPGLVIERLGSVLIAQLHEGQLEWSMDRLGDLVRMVHDRLETRAVYRKVFVRDRARVPREVEEHHHDARPWFGEPVDPELVIHETGLRFAVRPYDGFSTGLFLEHRDNRQRLRRLSAGKRVLNTFAYTCGFSVAAAAGGAVSVASVDVYKRYLEWGRRNFELNGIGTEGHWFFRTDVFEFYRRAQRQGRQFDLIVLDPPSFARLEKPRRTFVLERQLPVLCAGAVELLAPDGMVFLATNHRKIGRERLDDALSAAGGGRPCRILEHPGLPVDFAGDADYSRTVIAQYA